MRVKTCSLAAAAHIPATQVWLLRAVFVAVKLLCHGKGRPQKAGHEDHLALVNGHSFAHTNGHAYSPVHGGRHDV